MNANLPRETVAAGNLIFEAGQPGDCAYLIEVGQVDILGDDGHVLARIGEGELFGEIALLDSLPRTASVRAVTDCRLVRIDRAQINELLRQTDPIIRHLLTLLLIRFRDRVHAAEVSLPPAVEAMAADEDRQAALRALTLTNDLSYAIEHGCLELFYQPFLSFSMGAVVGFEALVRWRHPELGLIMPDEFVGLAERMGLVRGLSRWVLRQAWSDWQILRRYCRPAGAVQPFISVNLSAADLVSPEFLDVARELVGGPDGRPGELVLELRETELIADKDAAVAMLQALSGLGIGIALDDFGIGYSGLEHLRSLPISVLKLDKAFVGRAGDPERTREIVQNSVYLAWSLGLTTIAEGIEDADMAGRMEASGCCLAQGYYYARPMPLVQLLAWLEARVES